jgi:spore coat polysaccharide biosynthesis protein SpsF
LRIVAIIQARMGSTRLPGKVMMDLGGQSVLDRVLNRLRRSTLVSDVMIATTEAPQDDAIVRACEMHEIKYFRGSENDVLDRYHGAAVANRAEAVVRVTSDCPLIDPELTDATIHLFLDQHCDYASNVFPRTYPRGLDVEVFTMKALACAWREARGPHEREHVTPYFYEHPERFRQASLCSSIDNSRYRWTLDTPEDLELLRAVYDKMGNRDDCSWAEVLKIVESNPNLSQLNSNTMQKPLHAL